MGCHPRFTGPVAGFATDAALARFRAAGSAVRIAFDDIAVHASWSESLSNFLIEAQARGLPAVAYQAQGIAECFRPGETGWVIPRDDRDAFREAVVRLAGETPARRQDRAARDRKSTRLNSSHIPLSRMPSSA